MLCHWACLFEKKKTFCYNDECQNENLKDYINCRVEKFEYYTMARYRRQITCLVESFIHAIETKTANNV